MCNKKCSDCGPDPLVCDPDARVVTEEDVKIRTFEVEVKPVLMNPYWVYTEEGKKIGSANLRFCCAGIRAELFLDPATPERLDFEVDPNRLEVQVHLFPCSNGPLFGYVKVRSKNVDSTPDA